MSEGTPLYDRTMNFAYDDAERCELMRKVWRGTPFMTNCNTGSIESHGYREISEWCRDKWGGEARPIHGKPGRWQRGFATIHGWTWFGFESAGMLEEFEAAWECRDEV